MDAEVERVLWVGNLPEMVTEDLLFELFTQAGPVENVKIVKDRTGAHRGFAFVTFKHEESVPYTIALMEGVHLFGKVLNLQRRSGAENDDNPYLKAIREYQSSRSYSNNIENFRNRDYPLSRPYSDNTKNSHKRDHQLHSRSHSDNTENYHKAYRYDKDYTKYNTDKNNDNFTKTNRQSGHQSYTYEEKLGNDEPRQNRSFDNKESNGSAFDLRSTINQNIHEKNINAYEANKSTQPDLRQNNVYEANKPMTQLNIGPNMLQQEQRPMNMFFYKNMFQPVPVPNNMYQSQYRPYGGNS